MKITKMSLAGIKGKLSRAEMKKIMAGGSGSDNGCNCNSADDCTEWNEQCMNACNGKSGDTYQGVCGCP